MYDSHMTKIQQNLQNLLNNPCHKSLRQILTSNNPFKQFPSLTELEYQNIMGFIIVHLIQLNYVNMVQRLHNRHLSKQLLMLLLRQRRFLNFFSSTHETGIFRLDFINLAEPPTSYLAEDLIIIKVVSFLHLYEIIPFDFDLFNLSYFSFVRLHQLIFVLVQLLWFMWVEVLVVGVCLEFIPKLDWLYVLEGGFATGFWISAWPWFFYPVL